MLDAYGTALSGCAPPTPAHITLVPPTVIDTREWPAVQAHLEAVAAMTSPFDVRIRGTATFRPVSPVVFISVVAGISSAEVLAGRLRAGPLRTPQRFPYHPHVTIAQDLDDGALDRAFDEQAGFDAAWSVTSFSLYENVNQAWQARRELHLGS
jgi:2'-5' RNA ligase